MNMKLRNIPFSPPEKLWFMATYGSWLRIKGSWFMATNGSRFKVQG